MKISVVTTTINSPGFLLEYRANLEEFGIEDEDSIKFIVVGDNKTPKYFKDSMDALNSGLDEVFEYWSPDMQAEYIKEFYPGKEELLKAHIPENDPRRRNFGFLRALELKSDAVIVIDDDNLPIPGNDWVNSHRLALEGKFPTASSSNGIVNPCDLLDIQPKVYSRGYPIAAMFSDESLVEDIINEKRCMLNMGLWLGSPDVDSYTNLVYNPKSTKTWLPCVSVAENNYFPVNTQNTSFRKELSFFHNLYQEPLQGLPSHRYDDIWMGLIALKLIHHMGDTATFGGPVVEHRRNSHNYVKDLQTEFVGIAVNGKIWDYVINLELECKDYMGGYLEIAYSLEGLSFGQESIQNYLKKLSKSMEDWAELVKK